MEYTYDFSTYAVVLKFSTYFLSVYFYQDRYTANLRLDAHEFPTLSEYNNRVASFLWTNGCSQEDIGTMLEYSQGHISRLIHSNKRKLK